MQPEHENLENRIIAARILAIVMSEISERAYAAGWMAGLEYDLWQIVAQGKPTWYGQTAIRQEDIAMLRWLYERADGWTEGDLDDPLVPRGDVDHPTAFARKERERFFDIDVLAGCAGQDRH